MYAYTHTHIYTHNVLLWRGDHVFPCAWAPHFIYIFSSEQNFSVAGTIV